jgi:hypothetical protein
MQRKLGTDPEVSLVLSDDFSDQGLGTPSQGRKIVGNIVPVFDKAGDGLVFRHQLLPRFPTLMDSYPVAKIVRVDPVEDARP